MTYENSQHNDVLEPGDFVVYTNQNNLHYGFYRGIGQGTLQILDPHAIVWCDKYNMKARATPIFGQSKDWRVMRSHPDFVTKNRETLERAIEIIREKKILPVKY